MDNRQARRLLDADELAARYVVIALVPGLDWPALTLLSSGSAYGLLGLGPVIVLALWQRLVLLVPFALFLAEGWAIALWLSLWAVRVRREGLSGRLPDPRPAS